MAAEPFAFDGAFAIPPPLDWDDWLTACGAEAGFCQSTARARIVHARRGAVSHVLTVEDGGVRRAGALLSHIPAAADRRDWAGRGKAWLGGRAKGELLCAEGPVLPGADKPEALALLLAQVDALASRSGVRRVRFTGKPVLADWDDEAVAAVFQSFGYREQPWLTSVVDLTPPEDALFTGFKHALRKGIRKCANAGLQARLIQGFDEFRRDFLVPYFESEGISDPAGRNAHTDRTWWSIDGGRYYKFFVAKDAAGRVHATLGTYVFNGLATEIMSARTAAGREANLPAQDLLHWEAFRALKAAGARAFNLAGYNPSPRDEKEAGIRRYKEKWGGRETAVPQFLRSRPSIVGRAMGIFQAEDRP